MVPKSVAACYNSVCCLYASGSKHQGSRRREWNGVNDSAEFRGDDEIGRSGWAQFLSYWQAGKHLKRSTWSQYSTRHRVGFGFCVTGPAWRLTAVFALPSCLASSCPDKHLRYCMRRCSTLLLRILTTASLITIAARRGCIFVEQSAEEAFQVLYLATADSILTSCCRKPSLIIKHSHYLNHRKLFGCQPCTSSRRNR